MTGDKSLFSEFTEYLGGEVTFGDGVKSKVVGKGKIEMTGFPVLNNVLYVKGLKANLISISQLCDDNHIVHFSQKDCKVLNPEGECILQGDRSVDNCYCITPKSTIVCNSAKLDKTELWHQRLGHMNSIDLSKLAKKDLVRGLPSLRKTSTHVCGTCQKGKQIRSPHKKSQYSASSRILELIHMDLMGPMRTESIGGKKYILVMVDDFSRFSLVRFLREKSDTSDLIINAIKLIQNQKDLQVARIRSDNGTEFSNNDLIEFCNQLGIKHEFSAPYTPQQNGIIERKNRTIQEMARSMLHGKKVPRRFWAEAVNTACHIINRVYLRPNTDKTPYELCNGKKPNLTYFRIFGSKCYIRRDSENLGKFDS